MKPKSGRKYKLSDRDRWALPMIFKKGHKNTDPKIKAGLNDHLENPVFSKAVRELHKAGFHGRAAIRI